MAFFGFVTLGVLIALGQGAVTYAPADMIAAAVLWCVGLAATALIFTPGAGHFYRPEANRPEPAQR